MEELRRLNEMPARHPRDGAFELTVRCNLQCKMCLFRHADSESGDLKRQELSAARWEEIAEQAAEAGVMSLTVTGGEPLLRPDFCEIWERVYRKGFLMTLYTNATLVSEKVIETLKKHPPHRIGVTIYGAGPETYEKVTGSAGAFEHMLRGVRELLRLPSLMEYRTTVIRDNYPDVAAMEDLVTELSGGKGVLKESRIVYPAVRGGCADVRGCRLEPEQNIELFLRRTREKLVQDSLDEGRDLRGYKIHVEKPERPEKDGKYVLSLLGCEAGMSSFAVTYDGKMIPCQMLGQFGEDLEKQTFSEAWKALPWKIRAPKLCEKCAACEIYDFCAACPATRYAESGDMGGASDYLCQDAMALQKQTKYISLNKEE